MLFKDIIGQEEIKKRLAETVERNRLGHAWLFFGPEGTGKLQLAIAFARYISCLNRNESDSCGTCPNCSKYNKFIHPDLHFSFPVNTTKKINKDSVVCDDFLGDWRSFLINQPYGGLSQWYEFIEIENKQGVMNTEESKRIASRLNFKSHESEYKVSIIWQADKMIIQAANKLLKLIEEPPPMTIFILVSENPDQILPTIRSRCIHIKIPRIDDQAIHDALILKHGVNKQKAKEIARIAGGSYLKALRLINEPDELNFNFLKFRELMRLCYKKSIPEIMKLTDELGSLKREKQKSFFEYGLGIIRESLAMHYETPELVYVSDKEYEFTSNFAPFLTGENTMQFKEELTKASHDIERNANGRIVFLDLALTLSGLLKRK